MDVRLSRVERRALAALDLEGLVALLRELIAIPSLDGAETRAQEHVAAWMEAAGFERCDVHNLTGGIVAVHRGFKL